MEKWFSTRGDFAPKGDLVTSEDIFDHHYLGEGANGAERAEGQDAAKNPMRHQTVPST